MFYGDSDGGRSDVDEFDEVGTTPVDDKDIDDKDVDKQSSDGSIASDKSIDGGGGVRGQNVWRKQSKKLQPLKPPEQPKTPKTSEQPKSSEPSKEPDNKKNKSFTELFAESFLKEFGLNKEIGFDRSRFQGNLIDAVVRAVNPNTLRESYEEFKKKIQDVGDPEIVVSNVFVAQNGLALITPDMAIMVAVIGTALVIATYTLDSITTTAPKQNIMDAIKSGNQPIEQFTATLGGKNAEHLQAVLGGLNSENLKDALDKAKEEIKLQEATSEAKSEKNGLKTAALAGGGTGQEMPTPPLPTESIKGGGRF